MSRGFYFTPTYYCSSDCLMCGVAKQKRDERWGYTFDQAKLEIDRLGMRPGDYLEISGGEPTTYKYLGEIADYAKERYSVDVLVLSHGRHLRSHVLAEKLAKSAITRFLVPVFSVIAENHDYLTNVKGSLEETLEGLDNLRDLGVPTTIKFIPMLTNYRDLVPTFRMCRERYPTMKFVISGYQMMGEAYTNRDLTSPRHSDVAREVEKVLEMAEESGADVAVTFLPLCLLDPSFWKYYRFGYSRETVASPDKTNVDLASSRNYDRKPDACGPCALKDQCQWAWVAYCQILGTDELMPIIPSTASPSALVALHPKWS